VFPLILSLALATAIAVIGTICNLRIDLPNNKTKLRPLGWVFIALNLTLLLVCIYFGYRGIRREENARERAEGQLRRLEMVNRKVRTLSLETTLRVPEGKERELATYLSPGAYLISTSIRTGAGVDYKFSEALKDNGRVRPSASLYDQRTGKGSVVNLSWAAYSSRRGKVAFRFVLDLESTELGRGAVLGDFENANVQFSRQLLRDEIPTYGPRNMERVELVANTGPNQIELLCFDVDPASWEELPSGISLRPHFADIKFDSLAKCVPYPRR
jgi:hypothetical protein